MAGFMNPGGAPLMLQHADRDVPAPLADPLAAQGGVLKSLLLLQPLTSAPPNLQLPERASSFSRSWVD